MNMATIRSVCVGLVAMAAAALLAPALADSRVITVRITCAVDGRCAVLDPQKDISDAWGEGPISKEGEKTPPASLKHPYPMLVGGALEPEPHKHAATEPADRTVDGRHCWIQVGGVWYSVHC